MGLDMVRGVCSFRLRHRPRDDLQSFLIGECVLGKQRGGYGRDLRPLGIDNIARAFKAVVQECIHRSLTARDRPHSEHDCRSIVVSVCPWLGPTPAELFFGDLPGHAVDDITLGVQPRANTRNSAQLVEPLRAPDVQDMPQTITLTLNGHAPKLQAESPRDYSMARFVVSYCPQLPRCLSLHEVAFFAFAPLQDGRGGSGSGFPRLVWRQGLWRWKRIRRVLQCTHFELFCAAFFSRRGSLFLLFFVSLGIF
jgi:hypothetical protein